MNIRVNLRQQYQLPLFFALSLGLGWLLTLALRAFPSTPVLLPLLALPISYVPASVAWLIIRIVGSPAERLAFRQRLTHWRVDWHWILVTMVALPLIHFVGVELALAWGGRFPFHPAMLALLVLFFPVNLGEEIGWGGYVLPKLQERYSPLVASLISGSVWGAFHLYSSLLREPPPCPQLSGRRSVEPLFAKQSVTHPFLWLISLLFKRAIARHLTQMREESKVQKELL